MMGRWECPAVMEGADGARLLASASRIGRLGRQQREIRETSRRYRNRCVRRLGWPRSEPRHRHACGPRGDGGAHHFRRPASARDLPRTGKCRQQCRKEQEKVHLTRSLCQHCPRVHARTRPRRAGGGTVARVSAGGCPWIGGAHPGQPPGHGPSDCPAARIAHRGEARDGQQVAVQLRSTRNRLTDDRC